MDKLAKLQAAGLVAKRAHEAVRLAVKPGVTAAELEAVARRTIEESLMKPAFLGYKGYPAVSCISVNDEVVHGIPGKRVLVEGDIVSVDLGVENAGVIVDTARTHPVGKISPRLEKLLQVTNNALSAGIAKASPGNRTGDIGCAVENVVKAAGFYIIKDLTGHGVGATLQEPPSIPNFGRSGTGAVLKEGMVLAIEPITATADSDIAVTNDGWTIIATRGCPTAHFEDTVYLSKDGPIVLT